ncbi:MAG: phosphoribosylformylglycinamidine synthase I [Candidatus Marinimicrobia bacterium]|nr:phosphoribosylformylglycinamidine synthase I [Candidatus Neomarinimicrobiota bacterium]
MKPRIAIIQFPGSNTERETIMACERVGLEPTEFLWNEDAEGLKPYQGYIIVGGFSYEDRSRSGVIASLEPIITQIKVEAENGKPVLGICNGAQILVESGLVPGFEKQELGVALTDNKRIKNDQVIGVGYYNAWVNLKMNIEPNRSAFTRHLSLGEHIHIPIAHGEGRFIMSDELLKELIDNEQAVYQYCDKNGTIVNEFPTNPNGSIYNIAALCNKEGNIMAMMPHPERTTNGDAIFSSLKEYIQEKIPLTGHKLVSKKPQFEILTYSPEKESTEWVIDQIITDNTEASVEKALHNRGFDITVKRQTHWELSIEGDQKSILDSINSSGELYNSNKEYLSKTKKVSDTASFLVRKKDDVLSRSKLESLKGRFEIEGITELKYGVLWNITVNSGNFESILNELINTQILFNTLSHECYRIN